MVQSADYLEIEALSAAMKPDPLALGRLPHRAKTLREFSSPATCLLHGGGVDAAIGISVLLVYTREGVPWALLERRPKRIGPPAPMYHVIPAMLHQPIEITSGELEHASILDSIFREYLEELFRLPEPHQRPAQTSKDAVAGHPNYHFLQDLIRRGRAKLEGVALAFNLLNHRPDLCVLLLIDDEGWYQRQAYKARTEIGNPLEKLNIDAWYRKTKTSPDQTQTVTLPLASTHWRDVLKPAGVSPPGAAAMILGARRAIEILNCPTPAWLREFASGT
jgi:hypothetical protein